MCDPLTGEMIRMSQDMVALSLTLKPRKSNILPHWLGRATQAFFLKSLRRLNPDLSAAIHDTDDMKPFTASTLLGTERRHDGVWLSPGREVRLRYTTLHPHLSMLMLNGLIPDWQANGVTIHDQPLEVTAVEISPQVNSWTGQASFESLLETASPERKTLRITFGSPTAFKSTRGYFVPLPQPELVFGSLLDRWNMFSPVELPDSLYGVFHDAISVQSVEIASQDVLFGGGRWGGRITGFTGHAVYIVEETNRDIRRGINALAAFAQFSGIGIKTTAGLGQVRVG
ncbi:MAG: CRISPR-associated endoribonuclease Cas6 [Anaerolineae bacterium]|nr:CRISPR-associated endoribonuclease Cas6 [Anaerolineae bacterium]